MQEYKTTAATTLGHGKILLSDDMAKRHGPRLVATDKKGVYRILEPIQLKAGVTFSYDGPVNPALLQTLETIEATKAAKKDVKQTS